MIELGVHKQIANRLLEPFAHMTTLVTATDFDNFFSLRADTDAQPDFKSWPFKTLDAYLNSTPKRLEAGDWHIPFGDRMPVGLELLERLKVAVARAARVSYKTFDGKIDPVEDYRLHDRLAEGGHWSPFEHVAQCWKPVSGLAILSAGSSTVSGFKGKIGWGLICKRLRPGARCSSGKSFIRRWLSN
jgi:hypothetical protein